MVLAINNSKCKWAFLLYALIIYRNIQRKYSQFFLLLMRIIFSSGDSKRFLWDVSLYLKIRTFSTPDGSRYTNVNTYSVTPVYRKLRKNKTINDYLTIEKMKTNTEWSIKIINILHVKHFIFQLSHTCLKLLNCTQTYFYLALWWTIFFLFYFFLSLFFGNYII